MTSHRPDNPIYSFGMLALAGLLVPLHKPEARPAPTPRPSRK